jgi:hypothetical protein
MIKNKLHDSIVVPVGEHTFSELMKNKLYFFPRSKKDNSDLDYIFFYRVKPIQAITHYGVIEMAIVDADSMINIVEKAMSFKDPLKAASAFKLSKIIELKKYIIFDSGGSSIQGKINGNFDDILKLKNTRGLFKK